jgi:hypothetical protein
MERHVAEHARSGTPAVQDDRNVVVAQADAVFEPEDLVKVEVLAPPPRAGLRVVNAEPEVTDLS